MARLLLEASDAVGVGVTARRGDTEGLLVVPDAGSS